MRRALLMVAAAATLSVPASAAIIGTSVPAWASSGVTCGKLAGSFPGTVTFGKCTPKNKADKAATTSAASLATGGTLTWGPSGGTTTLKVSIAAPGQGACKKGSSEYIVTGSVTGGTSFDGG